MNGDTTPKCPHWGRIWLGLDHLATALAVLFAAFLTANCLRLIGPSCAPARDPAPWFATPCEVDHPLPESRRADSTRPGDDTPTPNGATP